MHTDLITGINCASKLVYSFYMKRFIPYVLLILSAASSASAYEPDSDGMYAVINVSYFDPDTSEQTTGEIAIQLTFFEAPVTVANFVGLATGELEWFDYESYTTRGGPVTPEPYYDGVTFHRVVPNFVIQTGRKSDIGPGNAGFQIPNEVDPALNHTGGGIVSMANGSDGALNLNSGGSQFFITAAQFPETQFQLDALNGKHSIFGFLREGQEIVQKINRNPLSGQVPVNDATITSIDIIKVGTAANEWDPSLHWVAPTFRQSEFEVTYRSEDSDTSSSPTAIGRFNRLKSNEYVLQETNDLDTWTTIPIYQRGAIPEDRIITYKTETITDEETGLTTEVEVVDEDNREFRFLLGDILTGPGNRSFYRLLEAELPELPDWSGRQLIINFDPIEDLDPDFVTFTPETLTIDLFEGGEGFWQMDRSDTDTIQTVGSIGQYNVFPVAHRDQIILDFDFWTTMQSYFKYDTPNSGTIYTYYTNPRPEGATVTGTFTIGDADPRPVKQNKDGTQIVLVLTDTPEEGDPITLTYTLNLWDEFSVETLNESFEGGYSLERTDSEFVQTGILLYEWFEKDGQTYLLLAFDLGNDLQVNLDFTSENAGTGEAFLRSSLDTFWPVTFTTGPGEGRPNAIDREGDRLILTLDVGSTDVEIIQSVINLDFYDNFEGGYETTRTDSEVNQFGDVLEYQWFEFGNETRIDLTYDEIPEMQVYLTFTSATSGTARIHYPQFGQVGDATFEYLPEGGLSRPERIDGTGRQLEIDIGREGLDILTLNFRSDIRGDYQFTRTNNDAEPLGEIRDYDWRKLSDNREIVDLFFFSLPQMQVQLTYTSETGGDMEVLFTESGSVESGPFTTGDADPERTSVDKTGTTLFVDLDTNNFNSSIDTLELNLTSAGAGTFVRVRPTGTSDSGDIELYEWFETPEYDIVSFEATLLLNQQLFLFYDTPTSGRVAAFFNSSLGTTSGTFTITE